MRMHTYLNFDGNCEDAFKLYEKALDGKIVAMVRFGDTPMADQMPPEVRQRIAHAHLDVGASALMGSDGTPEQPHRGTQGAYVMLDVDDAAQAERVFATLAQGGKIEMPLQETFWALRYGITVDRFGTPWMVNCGKPQS